MLVQQHYLKFQLCLRQALINILLVNLRCQLGHHSMEAAKSFHQLRTISYRIPGCLSHSAIHQLLSTNASALISNAQSASCIRQPTFGFASVAVYPVSIGSTKLYIFSCCGSDCGWPGNFSSIMGRMGQSSCGVQLNGKRCYQ